MSDKIDTENVFVIERETKEGEPESIQDLLIKDVVSRRKFGLEKYGKLLTGLEDDRDYIEEAYAEVLDLAVYLRAELQRRVLDESLKTALAKLIWLWSSYRGQNVELTKEERQAVGKFVTETDVREVERSLNGG